MIERSKHPEHRLVSAVLIAWALLGCGRGDGSKRGVEAEATPGVSTAAVTDAIVCNESSSVADRELYVLSAINRKLGYYPDLALAADLDQVRSCEQARHFARTYLDYSRRNPGFDADQPLGPIETMDQPVDAPPPELEVTKVRGGQSPLWAYPNAAVVHLNWYYPGASGGTVVETCTGYFIAKNWLVTAAHCLPLTSTPLPTPLPDAGATRAEQLKGHAAVHWTISWPGVSGEEETTPPAQLQIPPLTHQPTGEPPVVVSPVLQLPHPDFMGADIDPAHDLALIYLNPHFFDRLLPPRPDQGAAMRLAGAPLEGLPQQAFFAGYGDPGISLPVARLRFGIATVTERSSRDDTYRSPVTLPPPPEDLDPTVPPPQGTQAALCTGDSGGPLYQTFDLSGPGASPSPVAFGTNQGFLSDRSVACAPFDESGVQHVWAPNDLLLEYLRFQIEAWVGHCTELPLPGSGTATYLQCWGKACQRHSECDVAAGQYCSRPAAEVLNEARSHGQTCDVCGAGSGCGCIMGQCLPGP